MTIKTVVHVRMIVLPVITRSNTTVTFHNFLLTFLWDYIESGVGIGSATHFKTDLRYLSLRLDTKLMISTLCTVTFPALRLCVTLSLYCCHCRLSVCLSCVVRRCRVLYCCHIVWHLSSTKLLHLILPLYTITHLLSDCLCVCQWWEKAFLKTYHACTRYSVVLVITSGPVRQCREQDLYLWAEAMNYDAKGTFSKVKDVA